MKEEKNLFGFGNCIFIRLSPISRENVKVIESIVVYAEQENLPS